MTANRFIRCLADLPRQADCVIYGAGQGGETLLSLIQEYRRDIHISAFVDQKRTGAVSGITIIRPEKFLALPQDRWVLIATQWWYEVEQLLVAANYTRYLHIPQRFLFVKTLQAICEQAERVDPLYNTFVQLHFDGSEGSQIVKKLKQVEKLLNHPQDKALYRLLTCQEMSQQECVSAIINYYYSKPPRQQYLDFIHPDKISVMLDGGVYDGKETTYFIDRIGEELTIYGFEPNRELLLNSPYYQKLRQAHFIHVEKGLWSDDCRLFFKLCDSSSHITEQAVDDAEGITIDTISIDHFVGKREIEKIDFIKMDIEGAELPALQGARKTLLRDRPQLAICIYHQQSDYYQIPLYLDSILENYHYRLEHYTAWAFESVWYAIPDEIESDAD